MARHFVRLKLTLLAAGLRLSWQQLIGLVLSMLLAVPVSVAGFALLAWLGGETAGGSGLRLAFAVLTALWVVCPPLLFGVDETLDPARLRLLPLTRRQLAAGLLAASAVGVWPICMLLALAGAVAGFASPGLGGAVVVAAVVAQALLCLVCARVVTTLLSRWLRSRQGRDVLILLGALLGVGAAGLGQLPRLVARVAPDGPALAALLDRVEAVIGATPLAWAGSSVVAASEGDLLAALGWLVAVVALIAALATLWVRSLATASVTGPSASAGTDRPLFSGLAAPLPRTRLGAAAARELRYQWRVPQLRAQWLFVPLLGCALVAGGLLVPGGASELLVFAVCGLVAFHGFGAVNAFGGDRGAVWALVAAGDISASDIAGKNLAGAIVLLPLTALLAVLLAVVSGGWAYVPVAVLGAAAVLAAAYGVGNVVSVLAPAPLPTSASNMWSGASGTGCAAALAQGLAMLAGTMLLLPAALGVGLAVAFASAWQIPAGLLAAAYGVGIWWLGLSLASRLAAGRGPEMVAALSGGQ